MTVPCSPDVPNKYILSSRHFPIVCLQSLQVLTVAAFVRAAQVGIYEGAVSLATKGAHVLGVVSGRPIVVGGAPAAQSEHAGVTVAYCGRVPVRVPATEKVRPGDMLGSFGRRGAGSAWGSCVRLYKNVYTGTLIVRCKRTVSLSRSLVSPNSCMVKADAPCV